MIFLRLLAVLSLVCATNTWAKEDRVLHFYNWADYMTDEVLDAFREETGIHVKCDYFANNEELLAKLQAGAFAYDLVIASDYYVKTMVKMGLAQVLNHKKLPNRKNLESRFQNPPYDPDNKYSVPYFWGTTGLAYNREKIPEGIDSWHALLNPKWKRKINLLDDMREVIGFALRLTGHSINSLEPTALEEARVLLKKQKELIRTFNSTTYREILGAGDVWITQGYSGDIGQLRREDPSIVYVIPKEGGTIFADNFVIPSRAVNVNEAHEFINFLLRPDIAAKLAADLFFATPNEGALKLLDPILRNDTAMYPPADVVAKLEYAEGIEKALPLYEDIWIDLKTY